MANSKSNIYPIQLQGAELNLNKFDAEIKQYSGFNKNNAPFVGGCLSNLFTKNEQITNGNADNVYIAPNGDVYQVIANRFYKNGEYIRNLSSKHLDISKMSNEVEDETICKYFRDDLFITRYRSVETNYVSYKLYAGDNSYNFISNYSISDEKLDDFETYNLTGITFKQNGTTFYLIGNMSNNLLKLWVFVVNSDNTLSLVQYYEKYAVAGDINRLILCYNSLHNQVYCIYDVSTVQGYKRIDFYSIDSENGLTVIVENVTSNCLRYISLEIPYLRYYNFCNYPFNTGFLDLTDAGGFSSQTAFKPVLMMKGLYYSEGKILADTVRTTNDELYAMLSYTPEVKRNINSKGTNTPFFYEMDLSFKVKTSSAEVDYTKGCSVHFWTNDLSAFGMSFNITGYSSEGNNKVGSFVFGDYIGGYSVNSIAFLFNNNFLSGIACQGTLLTEWNSNIKIGNLFWNEETVYFELNGSFYKITTSSAKIRKAENQLIVNGIYSNNYNSYDLKRNKFLIFASAFNMDLRSYADTGRKTFFYDLVSVSDNKKIAAAINEYSPEDNSSLILNPVTFYWPPTYEINIIGTPYQRLNVYFNDITEDLKYSFTLSGNSSKYYDPKLLGLPFPIDSNGNVAYSPSLFAEFFSSFGNDVFIKEGDNAYQLSKYNNQPVMSFYLGTLVEGLSEVFVLQGQYYGIINDQIFSLQFYNGVVSSQTSVVSVKGLQFCGNTPYEALFYSKTNRCLYSFTGANILNSKQFVDKIGAVIDYEYNPATQSIFLLTDIGVLVYSLFGTYQIDIQNAKKMYLLNNGVCIVDEDNNFRYVRYYKEDAEDGFIKQNIKLDTMFYGMNNETVTINDCLYVRLFSEEHEEGDLEVSATTLSLKGRMTEKTTFKIKASDWDEETHSIYLRYQPKEQRGLGISFKIESPFKIASLSVGSKADAILVDKVSKGAINAPYVTSNNDEW